MLTYERRARWIRRMQQRAARQREREWLRHRPETVPWASPVRTDDFDRAGRVA